MLKSFQMFINYLSFFYDVFIQFIGPFIGKMFVFSVLFFSLIIFILVITSQTHSWQKLSLSP